MRKNENSFLYFFSHYIFAQTAEKRSMLRCGEKKKNSRELRKGMAAVKNVHTINLNLIQIAFVIMASPIHNEKREK